MSDQSIYRQVELSKRIGRIIKRERHMVAWIPATLASLNRTLTIKGDPGWKVVAVGASATEAFLKSRERDYLHQREASDI